MKRQLKRLTALILTLSMALGLVQVNAFATSADTATVENVLKSLYVVKSDADHVYNGKPQSEDLKDLEFYLHVIADDKSGDSEEKTVTIGGKQYKIDDDEDTGSDGNTGWKETAAPTGAKTDHILAPEDVTKEQARLVKVDLDQLNLTKDAVLIWNDDKCTDATAVGDVANQAQNINNGAKVEGTLWVGGKSRTFADVFEIKQKVIENATLSVTTDPSSWEAADKTTLNATLTIGTGKDAVTLTAKTGVKTETENQDFKLVYATGADKFASSSSSSTEGTEWFDAMDGTTSASLSQTGIEKDKEKNDGTWPIAYAIPAELQGGTNAANKDKQTGNLYIKKASDAPSTSIKFEPTDINVAKVTVEKEVPFAGTNAETDNKAKVTVKDGSRTLVEGEDYELTYGNNDSTGAAFVVVSGIAPRYTSKMPAQTYVITGTDISDYSVALSDSASATAVSNKEKTFEYNKGRAVEPTVTVTSTEKGKTPRVLEKDKDYTLSFANNTDAGEATVTITGKGGYSGTITETFTIDPIADLEKAAEVKLAKREEFVYDGKAKEPEVVVTVGTKTLVKDTDYTVSYENNVKSGPATVIVTGKGAYGGKHELSFSIGKVESANKIDLALTTVKAENVAYTGRVVTPVLDVTYGDDKLSNFEEYTVEYTNEAGEAVTSLVNKGTYTATLKAVNSSNFTGTTTVTFKITDGLTDANVAAIPEQTIAKEGDKAEPEVVVTVGETTLVKGTDYTVEFKDNDKAGTATATITGIGNYAGTVTKTFTVKVDEGEVTPPPAEKLAAPVLTAFGKNSNKANAITVQWSEVEGADGYTVYRQAPGGDYEVLCKRAADAYSDSSAGKQVNDTHFTAADHAKLYNYKVVAYKGDVEGEESNSESVIRMRSISLDATAMKVKGALNAKWDRVAGTGYLLQTATKSDFSDAKNKWIRPSKTNSWIRSKLPSGTNYVRVRAIRYYTAGDAWYYSAWSNTDTVTVR